MDASVTSSIIAGVGVILTAWLHFAGAKKGTLASAEKEFRQTLIEDNDAMRKRIDELERKLYDVTIENKKLKLKMIELIGTDDIDGADDT